MSREDNRSRSKKNYTSALVSLNENYKGKTVKSILNQSSRNMLIRGGECWNVVITFTDGSTITFVDQTVDNIGWDQAGWDTVDQ